MTPDARRRTIDMGRGRGRELVRRRECLTGLAALLAAGSARADYPERIVKVVVPYPAGGATDILARLVGDRLDKRLGQRFVIENRGGASGAIGSAAVASSNPDGYTLVMAASNTHGINPSLFPRLSYDPVRDFAPITMVASTPNILMVHPSLGISDVPGLLRLARERPGQIDFASTSVGGSTHMSGELLKFMTGVQMDHIPYRGGGPMLNDLIAGHIKVGFDNLPSAIGHVRGGSVTALAVTTAQRFPSLPDVPAIAESVPGYDVSAWFGLLAPARTPPPVIDRLYAATAASLAEPGMRERFLEIGGTPGGMVPDAFGDLIRREVARWHEVVSKMGVKVE